MGVSTLALVAILAQGWGAFIFPARPHQMGRGSQPLPVQSLMPKASLAGQVTQMANLLQKSCSDVLLLPSLSR